MMDGKCPNTEKKDNNNSGDVALLEHITPLAQRINCLDINQIAEVCVKDISALVGAKLASLYLLDDKNNILHLQRCNHPFLLNKIVSLNQNPPSPMIIAINSKRLTLVSDIDTHQKPTIKKSQRAFVKNYKTKNCMIVPLICQNGVVGVLNLADKMEGDGFDCRDVAIIELCSQLIGASIGNIKLFEKVQRQATTDGLTGLADHKTFYELLEKELWRSRRHGGQIALIMVDIDNLKKVNDIHGHRAGDKAIVEISKKIKESIRQIDIAARYGGDEFSIILPNTSLADAVVIADRMVNSTANSSIIWMGEEIQLSISAGVGQYDSNFSPEDITNYSDQALYAAKEAGEGIVRIFDPSFEKQLT